MKTLDDVSWKGKKVLIRVDLNTSIIKGKPDLSPRITAHAGTIKELAKKGAAVVVIAHQGRPGKENFVSLKKHAPLLQRAIGKKVTFVDDVCGKKAQDAIRALKPGQILLLENLRFHPDELAYAPAKKNAIIDGLAPEVDAYVNDAFSNSHRAHASMVGFASRIPCYGGRVLVNEVEHLKPVRDIKKLKKPCICVFGGAKPKENLELLTYMLKKGIAEKALLGGFFGQLCLIAKGVDFGAQNEYFKKKELLQYVPQFKKLLKKYGKRIITALDIAVDAKGKRKDLRIAEFPSEHELFDIGPLTIALYEKELKRAKTIFFKGPLGYTEDKKFQIGTKRIWTAIAQSSAFSVGGGGDTVSALQRLKVPVKKMNHVGLSGGAMDEFLIGKMLPGIAALKNAPKSVPQKKALPASDSGRRYDVVTVGSGVVDVFIETEMPELTITQGDTKECYLAYPAGEKIAVNDLRFSTGGGGTNTAASFAQLGLHVAYLGCLGKDENANKIMTLLRDYRISFIGHHADNAQTGYSVILNSKERHRTIFTYKGANNCLSYRRISTSDLDTAWFYFSSMLGMAAETQQKIAAYAKKHKSGVAFNPSMYQCKKGPKAMNTILKHTDILIFNMEEAQVLSGKHDLRDAVPTLHNLGPKIICITDGPKATYCSDGMYLYTMTPHDIKAVERTGAGDAFASGFVAGYIKTKDIEDALQLGLAQSESVIQHYGAKERLLQYDEAQKIIKKSPGTIRKERL